MWAYAADQHVVAVVQQMMRGQGCGDAVLGGGDVLRRLRGGDVLHDDFELRITRAQWNQHAVNEYGFAVKNVNLGVGHFAMYQQRHTEFLHFIQCCVAVRQIGHARVGIGGCACGVEFDCFDQSFFMRGLDVLRRGAVGQIQRH